MSSMGAAADQARCQVLVDRELRQLSQILRQFTKSQPTTKDFLVVNMNGRSGRRRPN